MDIESKKRRAKVRRFFYGKICSLEGSMAAITFDTMRFVKTLEKAGLPAAQAEAISTAFKEASGEAELATKRDIEKLEFKLDKESTMIKWMLGMLLAGVLSIVMKAFF